MRPSPALGAPSHGRHREPVPCARQPSSTAAALRAQERSPRATGPRTAEGGPSRQALTPYSGLHLAPLTRHLLRGRSPGDENPLMGRSEGAARTAGPGQESKKASGTISPLPSRSRQLPCLPPTPEAWRPTAAEDEAGVRITKFRQPLPGWNVYFLKMNRTLQFLKEGW